MNLRVAEPVDRHGKIVPIRHADYVAHPVVGHVVKLEDGYFAFPVSGECHRCDSQSEAIEYVGRRYSR